MYILNQQSYFLSFIQYFGDTDKNINKDVT